MKRRIVVPLYALALLGLPAALCAQDSEGTPVEIARTFTLKSEALGETRAIDVTLPTGYASATGSRYPVVVVLDGESEHQLAAAIVRFYALMSQLPPMIVVGVRNTDRTRDLTPAPIAGFATPPDAQTAGGADRFMAFLADELLPYLDRTYRTAPMRVLIGHSLGGLLAVHALTRRPDLFTGYVVMEPATWWNNQQPLADLRAALARPAARRARVMMVNTLPLGMDTTQWGGAAPMIRHLSVTGDTHGGMAIIGMAQALRTMFADFRPPEWQPGSRPIAMLERYDSLQARVGYAPAIPTESYARVVNMSMNSRYFDDAERALVRMEQALGASAQTRELRTRLAARRAAPAPAGFVQLEIPARRPTPKDAAKFVGRWVSTDQSSPNEVAVRASGDTIIVHDVGRLPNGDRLEEDAVVIQVTADGTLEWGLRRFRNIAALLVLRGTIMDDGTMSVSRQVRGWVPIGPGPDLTRVERFRRVGQPPTSR